ncbi:MAG: hypothetical protein HC812_13330 [Leptolyngbya sp. RL_3_1]|nr:hypothetical protein [Leptolyngbya sp. RL_3_1]
MTLIPFRNGQANQPIIDRQTIEISIDHPVTQSSLLDQAETLVRQAIATTFGQQSDVNEIEVLVLGDRHGEISPILVTSVSRTQWQADPQVSRWTRYYTEGTHALLQRHSEIEPTAPAATPPLVIQNVLVSIDRPGPVPLIRPRTSPTRRSPEREPLPIASVEQVTQDNLTDWD